MINCPTDHILEPIVSTYTHTPQDTNKCRPHAVNSCNSSFFFLLFPCFRLALLDQVRPVNSVLIRFFLLLFRPVGTTTPSCT